MKRILLINSPIRLAAQPSVFPIGLGIIASILEKQGYDVSILDANAYRYKEPQIREKLATYKDVDIVGISGLVTTYKFQKWVTEEIKNIIPGVVIILGGGCVTSIPEITFKNCKADFAVLHEGEESIIELIDALAKKRNLEEVRGIAFRKNGRYVRTEKRALINNLDSIPFPAYKKFPLEIYIKNLTEESRGFNKGLRSMSVLCSRGCPFNCNFCFHFFGGPSYRMRSVKNIVEEIDLLREHYNVSFFSLIDENLIVKKEHLAALCYELKKRRVIWECWGRADLADERLKMMADAGCVRISYGMESGSQKILNNMNKRLTPEIMKKAVKNTRGYGIEVETTWIYGYPGENIRTLKENYLLKKELGLRPGGFFINPYPGTRLYEECIRKGTIKDEEEFILKLDDASKFVINLTELKDEDFIKTVRHFERRLLIANCFSDAKYLLKILKYKWQKLKINKDIAKYLLRSFKNFLLIPYKIFILPDYDDFGALGPGFRFPRFGLRTNKEDRIDIALKYARGKLLDIGCGRHNSAIDKYKNGYGIDIYPVFSAIVSSSRRAN